MARTLPKNPLVKSMIIYLIKNKINGKQYVGQTVRTLQERWGDHLCENSGCTALKNAIKKYGKNNFELSILDYASSQSELDDKEQFWINKLNTLSPNGYNLKTGGEHPIFTEEVKEKLRIANTGKILSKQSRLKISVSLKEQWKNGLRKGHPVSEKVKYNLVDYVKKHGSWNKGLPTEMQPHYGKAKPKEIREKIAKTLSKPVLCVETGVRYSSAKEASAELHIQFSNISRCLHGRCHTAGGYHWRWA